jgi:crossover junction endodeoxyribonuclease RusA
MARHPAGKRRAADGEWVVRLPWARSPLSANHRMNRWDRAVTVRQVRETAKMLYLAARIPPLQRVEVELHWVPARGGHRDEDNLWPTLKAVVDALTPQRAVRVAPKNGRRGRIVVHVGAGIIPDDTCQYVARRSPHIDPPDPGDPHMFRGHPRPGKYRVTTRARPCGSCVHTKSLEVALEFPAACRFSPPERSSAARCRGWLYRR